MEGILFFRMPSILKISKHFGLSLVMSWPDKSVLFCTKTWNPIYSIHTCKRNTTFSEVSFAILCSQSCNVSPPNREVVQYSRKLYSPQKKIVVFTKLFGDVTHSLFWFLLHLKKINNNSKNYRFALSFWVIKFNTK